MDPVFGYTSDPVLTCEGASLSYGFNATDINGDDLTGDISPKNPFYLSAQGKIGSTNFFNVISGTLIKSDVKNYTESLSVVDGKGGADSRDIEIEVIEINNAPVLQNIGTQTVWLEGDNSSFYYVADVSDAEDGNVSGGNLKFNLTWSLSENLFDIGITNGTMSYVPTSGHEGNYSLTICVEDNALPSPHQNISLCFPDGAGVESVCDTFSLTVTDINRAPEIVNYSPYNNAFDVLSTQSIEYTVDLHDADGTTPDVEWRVDGLSIQSNEDVSNDSFVYNFGCGVSGNHVIEAIVSDGALNYSQNWSVSVNEDSCLVGSSSGGGGGGGGGGSGESCFENWACDEWENCRNVKRSLDSEIFSAEEYSDARSRCLLSNEIDDRFCGYQNAECRDLNDCGNENSDSDRSSETRFCYFTENPGCLDGITNCHNGACEILTDCGGPCEACATCSDGKQNQGEENVDCGGPCPYICEMESPFSVLTDALTIVAIGLVGIIGWILWKLFLIRKKDLVK